MLTDKEIKVLNLIGEDISYENYFFRKLKNLKWFYPLKEKGCFNPKKNSQSPIPAAQDGLFTIPEWNVLPYLEKVSQQVSIPGNEKYIDDLLAIIKDVSNYKDSSGFHIDNYRTWYYFTKILLNLPNEKITEEIINLIPIWLDSRFSTSLPGDEIAGKLLPKFLNSDKPEDGKKAESIIGIITGIKWIPIPEKQRSIYEKKEEPKTVVEPHWLRKGFEKNIERIGAVCSTGVINGIAKRILEIFSKEHSHSYDINYQGKDYQITHALIEDSKHQISLHSLKYPENWDRYSRNQIEKTCIVSFDVSDLESRAAFVAKVKESLIANTFASLKTELDEAISSIYSLHDYTYIGYRSLSASPDDIPIDDTEKILIYILKEILAVKARLDSAETGRILEKFLSRDYPYPFFKRLVLFVAGREWDKYKEYFFKIVNLEEIRCFEESDYATELSMLLKDNFSKFSSDEKEIIKNIIETSPQRLPDENPEKYKAYWKQKWLSLMKDDPRFAQFFEEQKKLTGINEEKFSFGPEFKISNGFGTSPLSIEEILNLTNDDLAAMFWEFRSEKKLEGKTVAAFSGTLKEAVKANPSKFTENLSSFEDIGFIYLYKILDGLKETWKEKKAIDWGKVFDFIAPYIKKEQFWNDEYVVALGDWPGSADHEWVTGIVAEIIQEGTRDDSWVFSEEHFAQAEKIVFLLLDNLKTDTDKEIIDYVTYTLNTPCGKLITALVYLALRIARVNEKKGIKNEPRWAEEIKKRFNELLDKKIIEAYTSLGRFLPHITYLDRDWVVGKIEGLSIINGSKSWEAFIDGYLSIGRVHDDLYELMKPCYQYGLSYDFKKKRNLELMVQHICVRYLWGHEKLDDHGSLFRKIIDAWRPEQIREVSSFFWMQRDFLTESTEENEKMKEKIIEFWRLLYEKYKDKDEGSLTREDKQILSAVSMLATFLPKIETESCKWLMLSSPYVQEDFNSHFLIEYLDGLKNKGGSIETAKYIGDIYLQMLNKSTPDYEEEHIRSIVEFLYNAGAKGNAEKICNIYGSRGMEFLRGIYEKHL